MMLNSILGHAWASTPARVILSTLVTASFAALARILHGVNTAGAIAGGLACWLLFAAAGPGAFAVLITLFVFTWTATRLGLPRKRELGLAENSEGRNARQVLANLEVGTVAAAFFAATGIRVWLVAFTAAMAEAAVDTVASEIGQSRSRNAVLITTWKPVPAGTDGGITIHGTATGIMAGLIVSSVSAALGLISPAQLWIPALAGSVGMLVDSLLGATWQRRQWVNNDMVNLAGTFAAAALAYAIAVVSG